MDRFTGLRIFTDLARSGSIAGTARTLGMSHTMATKHLNALEQRLGTKLVNRGTRSLTFTAPGQAYLDAARGWLAEMDTVEAGLREATDAPRGHIRLTTPVVLGIHCVAPLVAEFLEAWPDVTMEMELTDRHVDLTADGFDLAIRVTGELKGQELIARRLGVTQLVYCAAPSYLERAGVPTSRDDLRAHECLGFLGLNRFGRYRWRGDASETGSATEIEPSGRFHSSDVGATLRVAVAGLGVLCEPDFIVDPYLESGALTQIPIDGDGPTGTIYLVMPSRRMVPARVRLLADHISQRWNHARAAKRKA